MKQASSERNLVDATSNPYASPQHRDQSNGNQTYARIRSVARVFRIVGWLGVIIYTPIVLTCVGSLLVTLIGYRRVDSPLVLAAASAFNGAILALAVQYVLTGNRVARYDLTAKSRAIFLACVMMIGFPIFTIVGIICYRNVNRDFIDPTPGGDVA